MTPVVSVVMSVYNGERYLREAVDSILAQTFTDFEFVIVDDASTDGTPTLLAEYAARDARIVPCHNVKNLGLTRSLNIGLRAARGDLIARQDADDMSLPTRLAAQVDWLTAHPAVGLLGTASTIVDETGRTIGADYPPTMDATIRWRLLAGNAFTHSSVLFRRALATAQGLWYNETLPCAQDYALWVRMAGVMQMANLAEPLVRYRMHAQSVSTLRRDEQQAVAAAIAQRQLMALLPALEEDAVRILRTLLAGQAHPDQPLSPGVIAHVHALFGAFVAHHQLSPPTARAVKAYAMQGLLSMLRTTHSGYWWRTPLLRSLACLDGAAVLRFMLVNALAKAAGKG